MMKKILFRVLVCSLSFFSFSIPLLAVEEEGWRWRQSLDFFFDHKGKVYCTDELQGTEKIRVFLDGCEYASVSHVHFSLAKETKKLIDGNKIGKKPPNIAIACAGQLIEREDSLRLEISSLKNDAQKLCFLSGACKAGPSPEYAFMSYNFRDEADWKEFYEVYKDHPHDGALVKGVNARYEEIKKYIADNDLSSVLSNPLEDYKREDWESAISSLHKKLLDFCETSPHPEDEVRQTAKKISAANILQQMHFDLSKNLDEIPNARFADSEKHAIVRYLSEKEIEPTEGIIVKTFHLHTHLDVCPHCSKTISWFSTHKMLMPFISSLVPIAEGGRSDVRASVGFDPGYSRLINLALFWRKAIYPQCRIVHYDFPCKSPEYLEDKRKIL